MSKKTGMAGGLQTCARWRTPAAARMGDVTGFTGFVTR